MATFIPTSGLRAGLTSLQSDEAKARQILARLKTQISNIDRRLQASVIAEEQGKLRKQAGDELNELYASRESFQTAERLTGQRPLWQTGTYLTRAALSPARATLALGNNQDALLTSLLTEVGRSRITALASHMSPAELASTMEVAVQQADWPTVGVLRLVALGRQGPDATAPGQLALRAAIQQADEAEIPEAREALQVIDEASGHAENLRLLARAITTGDETSERLLSYGTEEGQAQLERLMTPQKPAA